MKAERLAAGLSIREVARRMAGGDTKRYDTLRRYVIRWESGKNTPDEVNRDRYADAVGIPRSLLREGATPNDLAADLAAVLGSIVNALSEERDRVRLAPMAEAIDQILDLASQDDEIAEAASYLRASALNAIPKFHSGDREQIEAAIARVRRAYNRLEDAITLAKEAA